MRLEGRRDGEPSGVVCLVFSKFWRFLATVRHEDEGEDQIVAGAVDLAHDGLPDIQTR